MPTSDPAPSDADLVAAAAAGDAAAFESLYRRHRDWALVLAYRFSGDQALAADAVQETFLYLLRKLPTLRLTARLTTFLYPAIKHNAQAARRKRRLAAQSRTEPESADDPWLTPSPADTSDPVLRREDAALLRRAIEQLPPAHREVVLMRYAARMSLEEIAEALEVPLGTVKSRLHLAVGSLRGRLGSD